jgi:hypothetical protein
MTRRGDNIIEQKWNIIKEKSKSNNYDIKELDHLTCDLIAHLTILTEMGITDIEGVSVDRYKNRVWMVVENAGLLPEYRDEDEDIEKVIHDEWEKTNDDFDEDIDDSEFYK